MQTNQINCYSFDKLYTPQQHHPLTCFFLLWGGVRPDIISLAFNNNILSHCLDGVFLLKNLPYFIRLSAKVQTIYYRYISCPFSIFVCKGNAYYSIPFAARFCQFYLVACTFWGCIWFATFRPEIGKLIFRHFLSMRINLIIFGVCVYISGSNIFF